MAYSLNNFTLNGNNWLLRKSILCTIFYTLLICSLIGNSICFSILSNLQTNDATTEIYKNKTITINYTHASDITLTIEDKKIDIVKTNSTFYTPLLPYQAYYSPTNIAKDIIDLYLNNTETNHQRIK